MENKNKEAAYMRNIHPNNQNYNPTQIHNSPTNETKRNSVRYDTEIQ